VKNLIDSPFAHAIKKIKNTMAITSSQQLTNNVTKENINVACLIHYLGDLHKISIKLQNFRNELFKN